MSNNANRIIYLEPNKLPAAYAKKNSDNVTLDNITWNQEDLNIFVDLQVIFPSRTYRKPNNTSNSDYNENAFSLLSGVRLKNDGTFLTDDYTLASYQEIRGNSAGSKEMLGINSIHIVFDSHMYPRVTMNFTDVRASALMMPQEQLHYDIENKVEQDRVCQSFFQSFFKFPYPRFLLSVKGIYGTCVTFVLSVEDFKATFNSESGNFDIVVTFIGLMYGLYTDIPMNYLFIAPYIGSEDGVSKNKYWESQTAEGGAFFFNEKDGVGNPICTFFEFKNNYEDLLALAQNKDGFVLGDNLSKLSVYEEKRKYLTSLQEFYNNIPNNIEKNIGVLKKEYKKDADKQYILLLIEDDVQTVNFNTAFVNDFSSTLKKYEDKFGKIREINENDIPTKLATNENNIATERIESIDEKFKDLIPLSPKYSRYLLYDNTFIFKIEEKIREIDDDIKNIEGGATEEMRDIFRSCCNFTPTIENVMRMIFAHLDAFLHEFYGVLEKMKDEDRMLDKKWSIENTDILSSSENNVTIPPFTAFYKQNPEHKFERIYPGKEYGTGISTLVENLFVQNIFDGLKGRLKEEAELQRQREEGTYNDIPAELEGYGSQEFTPIAITDYFYNGKNPYSLLNTSGDPYKLWYFALCRLYVGMRDFVDKKGKIKDKIIESIIDNEVGNLKNTVLWNKILEDNGYTKFDEAKFISNLSKENDFKRIFDIQDGYTLRKIARITGTDYYKFNGINSITDNNSSRENLDRFKICNAGTESAFVTSFKHDNHHLYECAEDLSERSWGASATTTSLYKLNDKFVPIATDDSGKVVKLARVSVYDAISYKNIWFPGIFIDGDMDNLFFNGWRKNVNQLFLDKNNIESKCAYFLYYFLREFELFKNNERFKIINDKIINVPSVYLYAIGSYFYFLESNHEDEENSLGISYSNFFSSLIPDFLKSEKRESEQKKLKDLFLGWAEGTFEKILKLIKEENKKNNSEYRVESFGYTSWTLDPNKRPLQDALINLVKEEKTVFVFPNENENRNKNDDNFLLRIDPSILKKYRDKIIEEIKNHEADEEPEADVISAAISSSKDDEDELNSLYYTLKNLYDRWLSSFSHDMFKLKTVAEEAEAKRKRRDKNYSEETTSEFDNFLYVDSFYNDIGGEFIVNPGTFYDIIRGQIVGDTNYNALEFIGKICQKNSLLFKCLPVYNNLYSEETFKKIFMPLSLYNGMDRLHRRIGNTYLIMYTYEPSSKLNLPLDKKNDASYSDDTFMIYDSNGITQNAIEVFNIDTKNGDDNYNICAFGVTPGMQNQSYFTKVSIGMDNPRVTDISIKNKFQLAGTRTGGRMEGTGEGQNLYSLYSNRSYDCNVEMLGCINIMPMMYFQLNNVPMFRGTYMITKVEHNIQNNTMTTKFTGTRLSRYFIPFNKKVFNLQQISDLLSSLSKEGGEAHLVIGKQYVNIGESGEFIPVDIDEKNIIKQPLKEPDPEIKFNVWAAVNQMSQCLVKDSTVFRPYFNRNSHSVCATAVENFLMAGFNGVLVSNSKLESQAVRSKLENDKNLKNRKYYGFNGYEMKTQLARLGFYCIAAGKSNVDKMRPMAGDVCVMKHGEYGHVCMYTGEKWVSDFIQQKNWWVYNDDVPTGSTDVLLYRYKNLENTPKVYGYFENGKWVDNHENNNGYDFPPEIIKYPNTSE